MFFLPARGVGADEVFVDIGTPAGAGRQYQIAVLYHWRDGDDVVFLGDVVDIDLHDFEVGRHGAHMRADQ
jgi:hypothetical protein